MNSEMPFADDPPDAETIEFLKCAFPTGLNQNEYYPLLSVLLEDMTLRAASWLVGVLKGRHYLDIYNDALGVKGSSYTLDMTVVTALKKRLEACGYEEWLKG